MCVCVLCMSCFADRAKLRSFRRSVLPLLMLLVFQVLALLASPASKGLFQAAMSLSGSPNISMPLTTMEEQGRQLVEAVGCDKHVDVLACMYALPYEVRFFRVMA